MTDEDTVQDPALPAEDMYDEDTSQDPAETAHAMGILEHLDELRSNVLKAMGVLVLTTAITLAPLGNFQLATYIIELLARPIGGIHRLVALEVTESIGAYMRVGLLSGFIMALPVILYELISFIQPGLMKHEKMWLYKAIPTATLLFIGGVAFAYFVMLPAALPFLLGVLPITATPRVSTYIDFVTNLMFWLGVSFETPLAVYALAKFNLVSPKMLLKQWRFAVVIIAVLAAVITPTVDPANMALLMLPLFAIYLLSILFAAMATRNFN